jgi:hypothetical protein
MNSVSNEANEATICHRVRGIIFIITVHQNFTQAFTAMYARAQADSRYLSP